MSKNLKILLVDDDDINNFLNEIILQELNVADKIYVRHNGKEALELITGQCRNGKENLCPDIIFLDINMPIMNGFEFLEEYKKLPAAKKSVVVILSSSENEKDINQSKKYGITAYINKPLNEKKIQEIIAENF